MNSEKIKITRFINDDYFELRDDRPVLVGSRCSKCGKNYFPRKRYCPGCVNAPLYTVPLSEKGRLVAIATCVVPFGLLKPPYTVGYVDLSEGVRLYGIAMGTVELDDEVTIVVEPVYADDAGREVLSYVFRRSSDLCP